MPSADKSDAPKAPDKPEVAPVHGVRLASPYGFYDDAHNLHFWQAGQPVTDAETIKLLTDRKAPIEPIKD